MIGATSHVPAVHLPGPLPFREARHDILRLMTLRELEDQGPMSGRAVLDAISSLTCSLELEPAAYSLIHDLRDAGLVVAVADRPPRYAVTAAGRREAERLAARCWPSLRDALTRFNVCIGCLSPRADDGAPGG